MAGSRGICWQLPTIPTTLIHISLCGRGEKPCLRITLVWQVADAFCLTATGDRPNNWTSFSTTQYHIFYGISSWSSTYKSIYVGNNYDILTTDGLWENWPPAPLVRPLRQTNDKSGSQITCTCFVYIFGCHHFLVILFWVFGDLISGFGSLCLFGHCLFLVSLFF